MDKIFLYQTPDFRNFHESERARSRRSEGKNVVPSQYQWSFEANRG